MKVILELGCVWNVSCFRCVFGVLILILDLDYLCVEYFEVLEYSS